jgi:hypothetical protein
MMMQKRRVAASLWALLGLGLAIMPAAADDPAPAPKAGGAELGAVQAFGSQNPTCVEWSDACFICRRGEDGSVSCSTAGIACTPQEIVCRQHKN